MSVEHGTLPNRGELPPRRENVLMSAGFLASLTPQHLPLLSLAGQSIGTLSLSEVKRPQGDSNPCSQDENLVS